MINAKRVISFVQGCQCQWYLLYFLAYVCGGVQLKVQNHAPFGTASFNCFRLQVLHNLCQFHMHMLPLHEYDGVYSP